MTLLYNTGVFFYGLGVRLAAWWNPKASQWVTARKNLIHHITESCDPQVEKIWMHCPSLGEFEQGRPVIEELRIKYPDYPVVITFFSPSGYEVQRNYSGADFVFYLPEDTAGNARAFVKAVNPRIALFVKYDFWLHYLRALHQTNCTTVLVSGIFRPHQHFFGKFPQIGRAMLQCFDHFFVQNQESVELLRTAGYLHVTQSGDTRFDRVKILADRAESLPIVEQFCGEHPTAVAGSTWPADEALLCPVINKKDIKKWIIAPHEISEVHIKNIESKLNVLSVRYSQASQSNLKDTQVLIIDNVGLLSRIYRYASVAYIGGGFGKSIHNILEAAAWGVPTIFGPRYEKFAEAHALIQRGGSFAINSTDDLSVYLQKIKGDIDAHQLARSSARNYVLDNAGATKIIVDWMMELLDDQ